MLQNNPEYRRLRVDSSSPMGTASYWVGRDHLLVVVTKSYVENYYRFLYRDIQALIIRRRPLRLISGLILSALTAGALLSALAVRLGEPAGNLSQEALIGLGVLLGLALVFGGLQTINLLRGPTCVCHLRTAVQSHRLPCVTRWRKAEQLLAELTPLAMAAQAQDQQVPTLQEPPLEEISPSQPAVPQTLPQESDLPPRIAP